MKDFSKAIDIVVYTLVIIGAINWGLVGAFNFDLVATTFTTVPIAAKVIYILVGLAGLYLTYLKLVKKV